MMNISIILATYNWPTALDLILANLIPQIQTKSQVELIIADDGSTSDTKAIIDKYKAQFTNLQHIWHIDDGFRKSMILNKAVAASNGKYLLFLDGDCIPFPDYIIEHIKLRENGYFVAGNRVLLSETFTHEMLKQPHKIMEIFKWGILSWIGAKVRHKVNKASPSLRFGSGKWRYIRRSNWKYPKGCNFAINRHDFLAVNGFDESFSGWGHEDADLFIRLLHHGVKIKDGRYAIPVLHLWHKESSRNQEQSNYYRLMERLNNPDCTQAASGIDKYIPLSQ